MTALNEIFVRSPHSNILHASDFDWINTIARTQTYQPGTFLVKAGDSAKTVYLPLQGQLATTATQPDGTQEHLTALSPGDVLGEMLFLENRPTLTNLVAVELSEVLALPTHLLAAKLSSDRNFAARFYRLLAIKLSERLRQLSKLMAQKQIKEGEPLRKVLMVFATLDDSDITWMIANGVAEKSPSGTVLIQQGSSVPAVYLLLDGVLGVYISIDDKGVTREIEVAKRVKGDILGEMSFVDGGSASATVKALENTWILSLAQPALAHKLEQDSGFASRFHRALAQILTTRCQDLLTRNGATQLDSHQTNLLSEDIEVEDELDLDVLEGTAIAGTRFDWMIQQLRR